MLKYLDIGLTQNTSQNLLLIANNSIVNQQSGYIE